MPISKHRPPMNVVRDFYKSRGMVKDSDAVSDTIKSDDTDRTKRMQARRSAMAGKMLSGGLCRSLKG